MKDKKVKPCNVRQKEYEEFEKEFREWYFKTAEEKYSKVLFAANAHRDSGLSMSKIKQWVKPLI